MKRSPKQRGTEAEAGRLVTDGPGMGGGADMNCSICGRSSLAATYYMYRKDGTR